MSAQCDLKMETFSYKDDEDIHTWLLEFERIAAARNWGDVEKLLNVPPLLKGYALLEYNAIPDDQKNTWNRLKNVLLDKLSSQIHVDTLYDKLDDLTMDS